uniref:NAD(P)H-binding protein n=1 Tax=Streptomyces scabiei TaxID=1930 RepID=UPI000AB16CC1
LLRASGLPCTIVRPGWFDHAGPTQRRLVLKPGGTADGGIARDQIAETLVRSLPTDTALGKTFELIAIEGEEPSDWAELFEALKTDESGSVDGVLDPFDLPSRPSRGRCARISMPSVPLTEAADDSGRVRRDRATHAPSRRTSGSSHHHDRRPGHRLFHVMPIRGSAVNR